MALTLICAFVLDMIFGDPYFIPHPICLIGKFIAFCEKKMRGSMKNERREGLLLWITVVVVCFAVPFAIVFLAYYINFYLGFAVNLFFCWQILAAKSLKKESMKVYDALKKEDIAEARKYLGYIVGRDTKDLDEKQIIKATVETVAENTTDGVVAPLLFMAIGGSPLGFLYKGINTMDSMLGYKNEKYIDFGRYAAKIDDVANFLPARLSGILIIAAAFILRLDYKNAAKMYKRDRLNHSSPNSAQTESACAGALNVQLGGNAVYFGKTVEKKTIGDKNKEIEREDIKLANRLMLTAGILGTAAAVGIACIIGGLIWM